MTDQREQAIREDLANTDPERRHTEPCAQDIDYLLSLLDREREQKEVAQQWAARDHAALQECVEQKAELLEVLEAAYKAHVGMLSDPWGSLDDCEDDCWSHTAREVLVLARRERV